MKRLICISFLSLFFFITNARAAMLSGNVSFNDITDLYTYTYTLDTTDFDGSITQVAIKQNSIANTDEPFPISHTSPDGWVFALVATNIGIPIEEQGSYWSWFKSPLGRSIGDIQTFSFTTERGINTSGNNNYNLFNDAGLNSSFIEEGFIVGPELINLPMEPVSPVPENETYAMMLAGLGLLGFMGRRKQKGNQIEKTRS